MFKGDDEYIGIVAATKGITLDGETTAPVIGPGGDVVGHVTMTYKLYCQGQLVDAGDCVPECSDGYVDLGELCDGLSSVCDGDCTHAECGDEYINPIAGEECDDGGESSTCDGDCTEVVCGDGVVNAAAGEACDDGNADDFDGCSSDCIIEVYDPLCDQPFAELNADDRSITVVDAIDGFCDGKGSSVSPDWSGPGLYRFTGELSLQMPETKPSEGACNTDAPGWLNGTHPSVEDGYAMREVCFAYGTEDCNWSVDVGVVDCGAFFLYDLPEAPLCDLRFCGE